MQQVLHPQIGRSQRFRVREFRRLTLRLKGFRRLRAGPSLLASSVAVGATAPYFVVECVRVVLPSEAVTVLAGASLPTGPGAPSRQWASMESTRTRRSPGRGPQGGDSPTRDESSRHLGALFMERGSKATTEEVRWDALALRRLRHVWRSGRRQ